MLAVSLPVMREILRFSPLPLWTLTASIAVGIVGGGWFSVAARVGRSTFADNRAQSD
jgi:hypothetical protein